MSKAKNKGWYCTCPGHISDMSADQRAMRGIESDAPFGVARALEGVGVKRSLWAPGQTITVGFIGGTAAQRAKVVASYAEWKKYANLNHTFPAFGPYNVRISFNPGGAWSYIGTDCKFVNQAYSTMNLGFDQPGTYLHEIGHQHGLAHEQSNPHDGGLCLVWANVIADLRREQGWDEATARANMTMLRPEDVHVTPFDRVSIMEYPLRASWMCNSIAVPGGSVLSPTDKSFISFLYPGVIIPPDPINITITPQQAQELRQGALNVQTATNAAKAAADAHRAKIQAILGN